MQPLAEDTTRAVMQVFFSRFIDLHRIFYLIDPNEADDFKKKNTYYSQQHSQSQSQSGCSHSHSKIYIPQEHMSFLQKRMAEITDQSIFVLEVPGILADLSKKYHKIKNSGMKTDKLAWDKQTEQYVLNQVLTHGVEQVIKNRFSQDLQKEQKVGARQPLLLATPTSWHSLHKNQQLTFLSQESLASLQKQHYCVQTHYMGVYEINAALFKELDYLEKSGRFEEVSQLENSVRNDRVFWLTLRDVLGGDFQALKRLTDRLSAVPYELNARMNYSCQISETFVASYFSGRPKKGEEQRDVHKKHIDSSFEKSVDTGKQLTCLYFGAQQEISEGSPVTLTLWLAKEEEIVLEELLVEKDMLVILKSRLVAYEVRSQGVKHFLFRFLVNGPPDLKTYTF